MPITCAFCVAICKRVLVLVLSVWCHSCTWYSCKDIYRELVWRSLHANLYCTISVCSHILSGLCMMLALQSLVNTHNEDHEIQLCKVNKSETCKHYPTWTILLLLCHTWAWLFTRRGKGNKMHMCINLYISCTIVICSNNQNDYCDNYLC